MAQADSRLAGSLKRNPLLPILISRSTTSPRQPLRCLSPASMDTTNRHPEKPMFRSIFSIVHDVVIYPIKRRGLTVLDLITYRDR